MIHLITDLSTFKRKALQWAGGFEVCCCLDSNGYADKYSQFDLLIAAGATDELITNNHGFEALKAFREKYPGWLTGFLAYDLKNETEQLTSENADSLHFPNLHFFSPQHLIIIRGDKAEIISNDAEQILQGISQQKLAFGDAPALQVKSRFSKEEYINAVTAIKAHIIRGDVYVTNFCQEFYAEGAVIDPLAVFNHLNELSPNPFAAFYKNRQQYVLCASPERFLAKRGDKLISQPIKGTAPRGKTDEEDKQIKHRLQNEPKELQENVMVVDLVRNDLTLSAVPGTVKVEELFGLYSFKQVHQLISTVSCRLDNRIGTVQAIRNTFPMGSMTGAPKFSSMQLMERYERSKRGVYSGAIGWFSPDDDFDFNVVIRSLLYNADEQYLSFHVGGAITYDADPGKEYQECLLKASAIMEVLGMKAN
jgi:para-aminobenzoate synthetase component I